MSYHSKLMVEVNKKLDTLPKSDWWEKWIALDVCKDHEFGSCTNDRLQ